MKKTSLIATLLTAFLLVFSGCSSNVTTETPSKKVQTVENQTKTNSDSKTETSTPIKSSSSTQNGTSSNNNSSTTPSNLVSAVMSKETDGDTIHVDLNGKDETIRMLLIDTPEDVDPQKPVEPFGFQAADYAKSVLPVGKSIYLELGKKGYERDKYNRLLAYIYITPTDMYNLDVVKKGLARVAYIYPPNTDHLTDLQNAENSAKSQKLGIWSLSGFVTPDGYNLQESCDYAKTNGYATRGCKTTSTQSTTSSKPSTNTTVKSSSPVFSAVTGSSLDVTHGQEASVTIKTTPGATGTIEVDYNSGPSKAAGLDPKTADSSGNITWSWKVGTRTAPGTYQVIITVNGSTTTKSLTVH